MNETEVTEFKSKMKNLKFGKIDIYFPVAKHRENWNHKSDELLIAVVDPCLIASEKYLLAYDLNGNSIKLSTKEAPKIPTLVVTPSEKHGSYQDNSSPYILSTKSPYPLIPSPLIKSNNNDNVTLTTYNVAIFKGLYTSVSWDDWFCGTECEFKLKWRCKVAGVWSPWYEMGYYNGNPGTRIYANFEYGWLPSPNTFDTQFQLWEADVNCGGADDYVADEYWTCMYTKGHYDSDPSGWVKGPVNVTDVPYIYPKDIRLLDGAYPEWSGGTDYDYLYVRDDVRYSN